MPLIFNNISDIFTKVFVFFKDDVKTPATTRIKPCPKANRNNINIARRMFSETDAKAIIPAKIGVEQGVPASAKTIPIINGYKKANFPVFLGKAFMKTGNSKLRTSINFKPITIKNDAIINPK